MNLEAQTASWSGLSGNLCGKPEDSQKAMQHKTVNHKIELYGGNSVKHVPTNEFNTMKKLFTIFAIAAILIGVNLSQVKAQTVLSSSQPSKKEHKAEVKLAKTKLDLEKSKARLTSLNASLVKKIQTFEKKNSQGKLSPNDVAKQSKAIASLNSKIGKEQSSINKMEAFVRANESF